MDYIKKEIAEKMKKDNVIKRMEENLQNDAYGEPWLKPLLSLIEYNQHDNAIIFFIDLNRNIHADHILPVGWGSVREWNRTWTEEKANKWLNKIGNLTLLSSRKNIAQQNDPPKEKGKMYKKGFGGTTAFRISEKIIPQLENDCWVEDDVAKRQKWAIEQIESILELKFEGDTAHECNTT